MVNSTALTNKVLTNENTPSNYKDHVNVQKWHKENDYNNNSVCRTIENNLIKSSH